MNYRDIIDENFDELAKAIILLALKDYDQYYMKVLNCEGNLYAQERLTELRSFFNSEWFRMLCDTDADVLVSEVERQCKAKHEAKIAKRFRKITENLNML